MFSFEEERHIPHKAEDMFDLVCDVESYPRFLPWCLDVRITGRDQKSFLSLMTIGFFPFKESFLSRVSLYPQEKIVVENVDFQPFSKLMNTWTFWPAPEGCRVSFSIAFAFQSFLRRQAMGKVFLMAQRRMVRAFEKEADRRYGAPKV